MNSLHRSVLYIGAFWEILRFLYLFTGVSLLVNPSMNPLVNLHILWLAAGQIATALLFFLPAYLPRRFSALIPVTAFFKFAGLLPALLIGALSFLPPLRAGGGASSWAGRAPFFTAAVDLFFLCFLIRQARRIAPLPSPGETASGPDLPDHQGFPFEEV